MNMANASGKLLLLNKYWGRDNSLPVKYVPGISFMAKLKNNAIGRFYSK
jgi:hypothetical protein